MIRLTPRGNSNNTKEGTNMDAVKPPVESVPNCAGLPRLRQCSHYELAYLAMMMATLNSNAAAFKQHLKNLKRELLEEGLYKDFQTEQGLYTALQLQTELKQLGAIKGLSPQALLRLKVMADQFSAYAAKTSNPDIEYVRQYLLLEHFYDSGAYKSISQYNYYQYKNDPKIRAIILRVLQKAGFSQSTINVLMLTVQDYNARGFGGAQAWQMAISAHLSDRPHKYFGEFVEWIEGLGVEWNKLGIGLDQDSNTAKLAIQNGGKRVESDKAILEAYTLIGEIFEKQVDDK